MVIEQAEVMSELWAAAEQQRQIPVPPDTLSRT